MNQTHRKVSASLPCSGAKSVVDTPRPLGGPLSYKIKAKFDDGHYFDIVLLRLSSSSRACILNQLTFNRLQNKRNCLLVGNLLCLLHALCSATHAVLETPFYLDRIRSVFRGDTAPRERRDFSCGNVQFCEFIWWVGSSHSQNRLASEAHLGKGQYTNHMQRGAWHILVETRSTLQPEGNKFHLLDRRSSWYRLTEEKCSTYVSEKATGRKVRSKCRTRNQNYVSSGQKYCNTLSNTAVILWVML